MDASDNVGGYTSLALDSNEHPHISYHDWDNQTLKYATWDGQKWVTQTVDSVGDGGGCSHTLKCPPLIGHFLSFRYQYRPL